MSESGDNIVNINQILTSRDLRGNCKGGGLRSRKTWQTLQIGLKITFFLPAEQFSPPRGLTHVWPVGENYLCIYIGNSSLVGMIEFRLLRKTDIQSKQVQWSILLEIYSYIIYQSIDQIKQILPRRENFKFVGNWIRIGELLNQNYQNYYYFQSAPIHSSIL